MKVFSSEGKNKNPEKEMAYKVFKNANTMYQKLRSQADSYLSFKSNRKINDETENVFELGFTPNGNVLLKYLNSIPSREDREFALKVAKKYKLIKENNGQLYDTFREELFFLFGIIKEKLLASLPGLQKTIKFRSI